MPLLLVAVLLAAALFLIPIGLPGTWIMVGVALLGNLLGDGAGGPPRVALVTVVGTGLLALVAEVLEFMLSGRYARKYGGSRRAEWGAILGGIVGAIVGVPVPIVGPMIGAFVGAFAGALVLELTRGTQAGPATRVATGALIGRAAAVAVKTAVGCAIAAWILLDAWT